MEHNFFRLQDKNLSSSYAIAKSAEKSVQILKSVGFVCSKLNDNILEEQISSYIRSGRYTRSVYFQSNLCIQGPSIFGII
jgi:hypothetical protein